jgi:hypothetical protein
MKQPKTLGLAVIAAAALMAFVGTGTASATVTTLCKVEETTNGLHICKAANQYPAGTMLHAQLEEKTKLLVETPLGKAECEEATMAVTTEQQTEIPLGAVVNVLTFGKCGEFTVTVILKGTLDIELIDLPTWTHNGTLTFTNTKIRVKKGEAECDFFAGHSGVLTGGAMATIDLSGTLTEFIPEGKCPKGNGKWSGVFTVTKPEPLWVSM